jgi:hypothetical protein
MPQEAPRREREHAERQHAEEHEREVERLEAAREGGEAGAPAGAAREIEEEPPPFPDYRRRTAEELVKRVRQLPGEKLDALEQYERAHKGRKTILEAIRRRREQISTP